MEKTIVLALASGQKQFSAYVCKLVEKYAEILASQGLLTTALELLKLLGTNDLSPELSILKDRIAFSAEAGIFNIHMTANIFSRRFCYSMLTRSCQA